MKLIFRRKPTALERLRAAAWHCASCGEPHEGLFHLSCRAPWHWSGPEDYEPNSALRTEGDFLSEDFCVIEGRDFFVRCVFEIRVRGLSEAFGFGIWSTLSRTNFDLYVEGFGGGDYSGLGPWTGWFSNPLDPFGETLSQPCWVEPRPDGMRPHVTLADEDHPLAVAQRDGITGERMLEIYAFYGHGPG